MPINHVATDEMCALADCAENIPIVRLATLDDLSQIDDLSNEILEEYGLARDSSVRLKDAVYFDKLAGGVELPARFWVAQFEHRIVGSIAVVPDESGVCLLKTFYVSRDHRGRGLGRCLYNLAETFARHAGYSVIRLYSSRRFGRAETLYLQNGFRLDESINNPWEDNVYSKRFQSHASSREFSDRS